MVKGRTSRTSRSGQRGAPKGPQSVLAAPEAQTDAPIADAAPETGAPSLPIVPAHPQDSLHEQLLESVSPDALETHPQPPEPESEPAPEAVSEAAAEPEPAALDAASEAPVSEPEPVVEPEPAAISAAEPVEAAGQEPESVPESAPEPEPEPALPASAEAPVSAPVSAPLAAASETVRAATSGFQRLSVGLKAQPLDIGGINATLFAFLRNESAAALAHIQALSTAKSPADLFRLQVGEMQRAADASLTCWNDLARKASHVVEIRRH
ncbi:hypothetical protein [Methylobacterium soli]|uniref:Phasin domain-containing protein n=1 Tax=Methylobacterium soli TaxID=553447 RepID=A0A6L3T109_9HYPH|nr:hypothetical protein [Methylobacterium soli]KAB1080161.1 hypothetical protein F6X53_08055 [Methylobacterium soli]GJE46499.1 hypothetical protein AEGHOMDF_5705 [Methylobacterium soli]